jgi:acyl-CoA reductase-like NAD-dependent aldehyde dehydrogenase
MAQTIKNVVAQVNGIGSTVPFIIGGEERRPDKTFDVINPSNGKVAHQCGAASQKDVQGAVEAASRAFKSWSKSTPRQRRDILLKATQVMDKRYDELAGYMMEETGCPKDWADFNLGVAKDFFTDVAGKIGSIVGAVPTTQDENTGAFIFKEPYGVVLAIAPW